MSTPSFDPVQYKAGQRQLWDTVAPGWKKWWPTQEQALQHVSDRLVALAELHPGHRVLDVGTGIGEPALTAAQAVGAAGHVVATDQAPQMLAIAQERALALGVHNVEFREIDAEALDFPDSSFDAILSRFALMFLPDLATALARIRRMLRPHGTFATAVLDVAPKVPFASLAFSLAQTMFQLPPPPPGTPSPFGLAEGKLEAALTQTGFTDMRTEMVPLVFAYQSAEAFTQYVRDVNAPLLAMLAHQSAARQAEYWQRLAGAVQQYAAADGSIQIPNTAICGVGRR
jgi:ubiquinone/menaquinone biosynthesis C-methylase UbiE